MIAVHSDTRPIERAVASAFAAGLELNVDGGLRVNVVCHNIEPEKIRGRLPSADAAKVRWLRCSDGIPSPAGPFNTGLEASDADYVSIMGSDDTLEPGALADWLAVARRNGSAAVIAPQRHANGSKVRTPPVRVGRRRRLHPVKDRLSYRTAPLGLIANAEVRRLALSFSSGHRTGEDQIFSAQLWFGGGRLDYARGCASYVVGDDAGNRVTYTRREVADELEFATYLAGSQWFTTLPAGYRRALVTKLLRVHVFGLVLVREELGGWTGEDRAQLARIARVLLAAGPGAAAALSLADNRLLDAVVDPEVPTPELAALARARRRFGAPATLLPGKLRALLDPESPVRFMAASALL